MFKREDLDGLVDHRSFFDFDSESFEYACKYLLEAVMGYKYIAVTTKGPMGGDGGIDLKLYADGNSLTAYGQCKLWKTPYQGLIKVIRELKGCMAPNSVEKGFLIVTINANDYEKREAQRCGIEIIDADKLDQLIVEFHEKRNISLQSKEKANFISSEMKTKKSIAWTIVKWVLGTFVALMVLQLVFTLGRYLLPLALFFAPILLFFFVIMLFLGVIVSSSVNEDNGEYSSRTRGRRYYRKRHSKPRYRHKKYRRRNYYADYRGLSGGWGR